MSEVKKIRVAIVEDDGILREALVDALAADEAMELCGAFADAESFLQQVNDAPPDAVIADNLAFGK